MYFSETYFHNFRNICGERREWAPGLNLIVGPNGSGKTNFLEGLNLISGWGPLEKNTKIANIIRWNDGENEKPPASLWGRTQGEELMEVFASLRVRCQLKCCDKPMGASDMRTRVPVLSFLPGHMSILKGGASYRRRLLDITGVLVSVSYARVLSDYRVMLRQKTALLRHRRDTRGADRLLVSLGSWLWAAREEIVKMIASASANFSDLLPRPMDFFFARGGGGTDERPSDDFRKSLAREADRERASGIPLVGPQRDDVKFTCGGMDAAIVLSRGQARRAVSVLIMASAFAVERRLARKPVLIFDEITSELDEEGRTQEIESLIGTGYQVFATTADAPGTRGVEIHKMRDGRFL
jgi:DNA replication and repair protein RecF